MVESPMLDSPQTAGHSVARERDAPIDVVVKRRLCHGCGSCASVCPSRAIEIVETASGFLAPALTDECTSCGLCATVCPGGQLPQGLLPENVDPFKGTVLGAYLVRANSDHLRRNGQSGGAVTGLLDHLLHVGECDGALVTGPIGPKKRPEPLVALTCDELRSAQGSKYCPVALNAALRGESFQRLRRPAVVGLPCHVQGIRLLQRLARGLLPADTIVLGLVCAGTYSFHLIDHLLQAAMPASLSGDFQELRYRDKASYGWPGDVSVLSGSQGHVRVPAWRRLVAKPAFRPPRCYLCFDQMNLLSDISFGDPWGLRRDHGGWTLVLTRTATGQHVFDGAVAAKALTAERIEAEAAFAGQTIDSRHRRDWTLFSSLWRQMGLDAPDFGFSDSWYGKPNCRRSGSYRRLLSYSVAFHDAADRDRAMAMAKRRIRRAEAYRAIAFPSRVARALFRRLRDKAAKLWHRFASSRGRSGRERPATGGESSSRRPGRAAEAPELLAHSASGGRDS